VYDKASASCETLYQKIHRSQPTAEALLHINIDQIYTSYLLLIGHVCV
jgi:hypothetical protein